MVNSHGFCCYLSLYASSLEVGLETVRESIVFINDLLESLLELLKIIDYSSEALLAVETLRFLLSIGSCLPIMTTLIYGFTDK